MALNTQEGRGTHHAAHAVMAEGGVQGAEYTSDKRGGGRTMHMIHRTLVEASVTILITV